MESAVSSPRNASIITPLQRMVFGLCAGFTFAMGSKFYRGPHEEWIQGYSWDIVGPLLYYHTVFRPSDPLSLKGGMSLAVPALYELGQYLHVLPGRFDPKDFLAYGIGVAVAVGIDKLLQENPVTLEQIAGV